MTAAVYGRPPADLVELPPGAVQLSPLIPGSVALEDSPDGSLDAVVMLAPPGAVERRFGLAHALRALRPGGMLTALAPKDRGGARLRGELKAFGCTAEETAKRHHRICVVQRPVVVTGLDAALAAGALQQVAALGLWSQPGVFSWDRIDPGSALLLAHLPPLAGRGADLGAGLGVLARRVLESPNVTALMLVDIDRRAVAAARRNVEDPRAAFVWADVRAADPGVEAATLDFVVMNPPFHDAGAEDRALGQAFIRRAAALLRRGGVCWLTANRHLPYEKVLGECFAQCAVRAEAAGYKIVEAKR